MGGPVWAPVSKIKERNKHRDAKLGPPGSRAYAQYVALPVAKPAMGAVDGPPLLPADRENVGFCRSGSQPRISKFARMCPNVPECATNVLPNVPFFET